MNILKHFREQPFVVFVALAALPHSTWAIATYMSGVAPQLNSWGDLPAFLWWVVPALFLAIAMDVGFVVTAGEIRAGNQSKWLVNTFYSLAFASYILQFLFVIHHAPAVPVGAGASPIVSGIGSVIQQICIFILPALLPGATVLYTLAHHETGNQNISLNATRVNENAPNLNDGVELAIPIPYEVEQDGFLALPVNFQNGHAKHEVTS